MPGIEALDREIFGPVLHLATFDADELDAVIDAVNATGYGLTFGLQTRIDDRVQHIVDRVAAGNIYVNRNQIGAVVGSQPFGGEGLSGTGPKAGGPHYLRRFAAPEPGQSSAPWDGDARHKDVADALATAGSAVAPGAPADLPGPTGEANRLSLSPRGPILCLGPSTAAAEAQAAAVTSLGGVAVCSTGALAPDTLETLNPLAAVLWWGDAQTARAYESALARRDGPIVPLITDQPDMAHVMHERHVCIDTTAAGGNATLLAEVAAVGA